MSSTEPSDDESRDTTADEPVTVDTCRADYEAGDADRATFDRHTARYHSEWRK